MTFVDIGGLHLRSMWVALTVVGFKVDVAGYAVFVGSVGDHLRGG